MVSIARSNEGTSVRGILGPSSGRGILGPSSVRGILGPSSGQGILGPSSGQGILGPSSGQGRGDVTKGLLGTAHCLGLMVEGS